MMSSTSGSVEPSHDHVALLRGVNVGGVTIRSAELRSLLEQLGFDDVATFLATGNVRFTTPPTPELKQQIEQGLSDRFGYTAWIVLVTAEQLQTALDGYPFDAADPARTPYLVFTAGSQTLAELEALAAQSDPTIDPTAVGPGVIYWAPPRGESTSTPFAKELSRSKWKAVTTTRNLRTVAKILR